MLFYDSKRKERERGKRKKMKSGRGGSAPEYRDFDESVAISRLDFHSRLVSLRLIDPHDLGMKCRSFVKNVFLKSMI